LDEWLHNAVNILHMTKETVMNAIDFIKNNITDQNFLNGFAVGIMIQKFVDREFENTPYEYSDFQDWLISICSHIEGKDVQFVSHNQIKVGEDSIFISDSSYYYFCRYNVVTCKDQAEADYYDTVTPSYCDEELPF
jgi:hypothetical protein